MQLTRCEDVRLNLEKAQIVTRCCFWRNENALWNSGTLESINPGTPQFETYRAHYDPARHIVLIDQAANEYGDTVYAISAKAYPFARANLSDALPIKGLRMGETREEVVRNFGSGYRHDECGSQQYYYKLDMPYQGGRILMAFILTFERGRLVKFVRPSLEG